MPAKYLAGHSRLASHFLNLRKIQLKWQWQANAQMGGCQMKRTGLLVFLLSPLCIAHAQVAIEVPAPLSQDAVAQLLQGATVDFTSSRGNRLSWKNDLDGTMLASSVSTNGRNTTRKGRWKIDDKGRFCVSIDWPSNLEEWCRYVVRDGDIYYVTRSNGERVSRLSVTR